MLVDSHCHLDRLRPDKNLAINLDDVIEQARAAGVAKMLCVGIDMNNAGAVKAIAEKYPSVYASVGVHPLDIDRPAILSKVTRSELIGAASHPRVVAIGETGLDYYYSADNKVRQQESLVMHLQVARELGLPTIIHSRDAKEDTLAILAEHACREKAGVLHCFTEDWDMASRALELGFYISFSGIVTFSSAKELQDVARQVPIERILVETDSPYLAPVPFRGKPNFPKYTRQVAEFIAGLRGDSFERFAHQTTENFHRLFSRAL